MTTHASKHRGTFRFPEGGTKRIVTLLDLKDFASNLSSQRLGNVDTGEAQITEYYKYYKISV